jgi:hypothetical protein
MTLKLRPTGLGSGIDKDRSDYAVYSGEWNIGRIYETRGGPESLRWFWSMTANGPMMRADRVATLDRLRRSFRRAGMRGRLERSWKRSDKRTSVDDVIFLPTMPRAEGIFLARLAPTPFACWRTSFSSLHRKLAVFAT